MFSVNLPGGLPEANGVIITLDQAANGDWTAIDAVELVGSRMGDASETEPTSLDMSDYPMYEIYTNAPPTQNTITLPDANTSDNDTPPNVPVDPSGGQVGLTQADFNGEWGVNVTCPSGFEITNGVAFTIVQQRTGSQYRVTALGMNGLDTVLAVMDTYGNMICSDDNPEASTYSANLPSTGQINAAGTHAQVLFNVGGPNAFENITVVVGGYGGVSGEVAVIVEGMIASQNDGAGDPFSVYISPNMFVSGVVPTAYMISVVQRFDPAIFLMNADYQRLNDDMGNLIACDDAGTSLCWGESVSLAGYYVSRSQNRRLGGGNLDAMLRIPFIA